jgi:hypothetical protein
MLLAESPKRFGTSGRFPAKVGEKKKALTDKIDKCLKLLERDTRFERATFSLGS